MDEDLMEEDFSLALGGTTSAVSTIPLPLGGHASPSSLPPCQLPAIPMPYQAANISYLYPGEFGTPFAVPTSRSLQSRLDDWLSIVDFGARGDLQCDSAPAINAAIAAAQGRTIFWPAGTYRVASEIILPSDSSVSFAGSGPASTFVVAEHQDHSIFDLRWATNVDIRSMAFVGIGGNCGLASGSSDSSMGASRSTVTPLPSGQLISRTTLRDFAVHGRFASAHLCQGPGGDHNITNMRLIDIPQSIATIVVGYRLVGSSQLKSSTLMVNPRIELRHSAPSSRAMVLQQAANLTVMHAQIETDGTSAQIALTDGLKSATFVGGRIRYKGNAPHTFHLASPGQYENLTLRAFAIARIVGVSGANLRSLSMINTARSQPSYETLIDVDTLINSRIDYARHGVKVHNIASGNEFFDAGNGSALDLPPSALANRYYFSREISGQKVASIRVDGLARRIKKIDLDDFVPTAGGQRYSVDSQTDVLLIDGATLVDDNSQYTIWLPNKGRKGQTIVIKAINYQATPILKVVDTANADLNGGPAGYYLGCKLEGYQYLNVTAGAPRQGADSKGNVKSFSSWWVTGGKCVQ